MKKRQHEMKNILYYISGHGYGHATRSIEIIRHILLQRKDILVHVKTDAPEWLFKLILNERFLYHQLRHDIGAVQEDSFSVNKEESLRQYAQLIENKSHLLAQEAAFVEDNKINLVVGDISPLAFEVAEMTNLLSVAVGNFSWDWIYSAWMEEFPQYQFIVDDIAKAYAKADILLRLPFYGDMSAFSPIEDMPIVGRKTNQSREDTLSSIGLSGEKRRIVLLGLRRQDLQRVDWKKVERMADTLFISFVGNYPANNFIKLESECVPFQNLVNAVDAVLSKPGYGIVAECIVNRTPILYVPRSDFAEEAILRQALKNFAVAQMLPLQNLRSGSWSDHFSKLFQDDRKWPPLQINGAQVVAEKILARLV